MAVHLTIPPLFSIQEIFMKIYKTFQGFTAVAVLIIILCLFVHHIVTSDDGAETLAEHVQDPPFVILDHDILPQPRPDASVKHTHPKLTHSHANWSAPKDENGNRPQFPEHTHAAVTHGPHPEGREAHDISIAIQDAHHDASDKAAHDATVAYYWDSEPVHRHKSFKHIHTDDTSHGDGLRHLHNSYDHPNHNFDPPPTQDDPPPARDPDPPPMQDDPPPVRDPALVAHSEDVDAHHSDHTATEQHQHGITGPHTHDSFASHTHAGFLHTHPAVEKPTVDPALVAHSEDLDAHHSDHTMTGEHRHGITGPHTHDSFASHTHGGYLHTHPAVEKPPGETIVEKPPDETVVEKPPDETITETIVEKPSVETRVKTRVEKPPVDTTTETTTETTTKTRVEKPSDETMTETTEEKPSESATPTTTEPTPIPTTEPTPIPITTEPTPVPTTETLQQPLELPIVTEYMLYDFSHGQRTLPQWIELYNPNDSELSLTSYLFSYTKLKRFKVGYEIKTHEIKRLANGEHFVIPGKGAVILTTKYVKESRWTSSVPEALVYNLGIGNALKRGWRIVNTDGKVIHESGTLFGVVSNPQLPKRGQARLSFNVMVSEAPEVAFFYGHPTDISTPAYHQPPPPAAPTLYKRKLVTRWAGLKQDAR